MICAAPGTISWVIEPARPGASCRMREHDHDQRAVAAGAGPKASFRIVALRDFAHDREPQPAAFGAAAEYAVEAFEHALALGDRNAGAIVFDT